MATQIKQTQQNGYKQTEMGVIPEDWEVKVLDDITISVASGRSNTSSEIGNYPIYGSTGIIGYKKSKDYEGDKLLVARVGANAGTVNKVSGEYCVSDNTIMITYPRDIDIDFSYYQLVNFKLNKIIFGSGQPLITGSQIKKLKIPIPPTKAEQTAIATVLSDADALISSLEKLIAKKRKIKQGVMQQLLTGKKRLPGFSGEWEVKKLGEIFTFLNTANNSREDLMEGGEIGYIHYGDIHTKWSNFLDCSKNYIPYIIKEKIKDIPFLKNGDLVVADASEDYEGIGVCVEIKNIGERNVVAGLHTLLLRGNKSIVVDGFKGYLREIEGIKDALIKMATGISVYGISKNNLKNVKIRIPPIKEQTAIAQVLSDMDAEIEKLEQKLDKYRMIKQGMMQELLTGKTRLI